MFADDQSVSSFIEKARTVNECLHAYGIHSATLQPETVSSGAGAAAPEDGAAVAATATPHGSVSDGSAGSSLRRRRLDPASCQMICSSLCHNLMCCTEMKA